jgi:hypothetical protein
MRHIEYGNEGTLGEELLIHALDEPGDGGACHEYEVVNKNTFTEGEEPYAKVSFQNGPINENKDGVNGCSNEALLAIVIDRLEGFSTGPYPSRETSVALRKCQEALMWLEQRTKDRARRGVEGKHLK